MQTAIPSLFMRGGSSRGPFFLASDLPADIPTRDRVLLAVMGSPDRRQIDGMGGAHPLTSKVGIVSPSHTPGVALDFLFAQLQPDKDTVDTSPNCGNMLAAVVPFALERGLIDRLGSFDDAVQAAAKLAKLEGEPHVSYVERELSRTERLLSSLGDVLAPALLQALQTQLGFAPPALLVEAGRELAWLGELSAANGQGKMPFATIVHCLCRVP